MNITHICLCGVSYTENYNYQENYLTKYHSLAGHKVSVITTQYCWDHSKQVKCLDSNYTNQYGVTVFRIPYALKIPFFFNRFIGIFHGLNPLLYNLKPDIIFIHNCQFQDVCKIIKYKKKHPHTKIYIDNHADFSNSAQNWLTRELLYKRYWKKCFKAIEPFTECFYGVLPARVDFLQRIFNTPPSKTKLLLMGADDYEVSKVLSSNTSNEIREKYGIAPDDFVIITGGKIDHAKKQTLLLMEAVKNLKDSKVKLLVFGSLEEDLQDQFYRLCDDNTIHYAGWINGNESYAYFAAADLAVFPGRHSVYWEQVAGLGIPMVCKYWDGTTHVDMGGNVIFLHEDSVSEIQSVLSELIEKPELYHSMKDVALKGKAIFSYENIAKKSIEN